MQTLHLRPFVGRRPRRFSARASSAVAGFTLVEIMIVVAIIGLIAAMGIPGLIRARKRTQATAILNELRLIDSAMDQYALEYNKKNGDVVTVAAWQMYVKPATRLYVYGTDLFGAAYGDQVLGNLPPVPSSSYDALSSVADSAFWAPYVKGP